MDALAVVAVSCLVVLTAAVVKRQFFTHDPIRGAPMDLSPVRIPDWRDYLDAGHRLGPADAPVTILEFADYECPFCRTFQETLNAAEARYPGKIAVVYRNWPLAMHRFAYPAARAAECAARQGKFWQYHDLLFAEQDSLGFKSFTDFARDAAVQDSAAFAACARASAPVPAIDSDAALAMRLGGQGTPMVIINGVYYRAGIDGARLDSIIHNAAITAQ